jgi:hypothetical protein
VNDAQSFVFTEEVPAGSGEPVMEASHIEVFSAKPVVGLLQTETGLATLERRTVC